MSNSSERNTELDSITFLEYLETLGASNEAVSTATIWTRAMLGQDPIDLSALFFLQYCKAGGGLMQMRSDREHGGQYLRVRQGTQTLAVKLAESLPEGTIQYESPVSSIEQLDTELVRVFCRTTGESFQARKVICAIPPPVLTTLTFSPALSSKRRQLLESYKYGYYQKVMVVFQSAFWVSLGFCGLVQSFKGPACVIRDTSVEEDGMFVLTCFIGGSTGASWAAMSTEVERSEAILDQIGNVFGNHDLVRKQLLHVVGFQWNDEEWNGFGCPSCALTPGTLTTLGATLKESEGNIYFAGTETSDVWRGYMEGAVRSGEREAQKVIALSKKT